MKNIRLGISLISLIITIIVIIILIGVVTISLFNNDVFDKGVKARFMNDFTTVQDGVRVYSSSKYNPETKEFDLPLKGYLNEEDKSAIKINMPTLHTKIEQLSGSIDTSKLAWIDSDDINIKLRKPKAEKGYIMDVETGQIYDYNGDFFEKMMWHTLDSGVQKGQDGEGEGSSGYIILTLYYPDGSTDREWRLGNPGELRLDPILHWQEYKGPIKIPIYRTEDVWIQYTLNGEKVIVPPTGKLLVDIVADETIKKVDEVNVTINFDEDAYTKEYRVGNSGWLPYMDSFVVTENTIVAARSTKTDEIKDNKGNVILSTELFGSDKIFIGNIGLEESDLEAPIIERLPAIKGNEKARVKITYPEISNQEIYKVNLGQENIYTDVISIDTWGTSILAYYYDVNTKRSKGAIIVINDDTIEPPEQPKEYEPIDKDNPNDPNNPYNPSHPDNPNNPDNPYNPNHPDNPNNPNNPNNPSNPNHPNDPNNPDNKDKEKLNVDITANPEPLKDSTKVNSVLVSIDYDIRSLEKTYKINDGPLLNYTGSFTVTENSTIYAYAKAGELKGEASKLIDNLNFGIAKPIIATNPSEGIKSAKVKVNIEYDKNAVIRKYKVDNGELLEYTNEFEVSRNGTIIYAYNENSKGESAYSTYTISNIDENQNTVVEEAPEERVTVLEYGKYYIMKLTYPEGSKVKDYKYTENGEWKKYKPDGIMLIKSEYKSEVLSSIGSDGKLNITDEQGNIVKFSGDWYFINTTIDALIENLFMRWDLTEMAGPQIFSNTNRPAKDVTITIIYPEASKKKEFKIKKPNEEIPKKWEAYTKPFIVNQNNTIIYAKFTNKNNEVSAETTYTVTNIDEEAPVIKLIADLITQKDSLSVKVEVTDNMEVDIVKWASGVQGESYFENKGIEILNNSSVVITENGVYTFFASDAVGNKQTYTLTVNNIVQSPPTVRFTPDGQTYKKVGSTKVEVFSESESINNNSLEYSWSTSNVSEPTIGWTKFTNGQTIEKTNVEGIYYLWVKARNNSGLQVTTNSSGFEIDGIAPSVTFNANGYHHTTTVSTVVTVTDNGTGIKSNSLEYVWDSQDKLAPASGWLKFTNQTSLTISKEGINYLWIKAEDNVGNATIKTSNPFLVGDIVVSEVNTYNKTFSGESTGYSYNNPVIPAGFVAVDTEQAKWTNLSTDWNNGLVIQDTRGNQFVWVPVDGTNVKYEKWCTTNISYIETSEDTLPSGYNVSNITLKYKGFYIARFEASSGSGSAASSKKKSTVWTGINYNNSKIASEQMASKCGYNTQLVGTMMVNGTQWDTVMKWIQNSGISVTDSRTWGNHNDSIYPANVSGYSRMQVTGFSDYWKAKNIYDLAGNAWEWTSEIYDVYRIWRSGHCFYGGSSTPAAYRNNNGATFNSGNIGFRVSLYIM